MDNKILLDGVTFDDVLLLPALSSVSPDATNITSESIKGFKMKLPIFSSAMDTITESQMAIAMARHGGCGIIHRNLTIEEQVNHISVVKKAQSGMIFNSIKVYGDMNLIDVENICSKYRISGLPVVDKDDKLIGIISNRDMLFEEDKTKLVREVMRDKDIIVGDLNITEENAFQLLKKYKIEKLPLVDSIGKLCGLITLKDYIKKRQYPNASIDKQNRLVVGAAIGITGDYLERATELVNNGVDILVIDTAHGQSDISINLIKILKNKFTDIKVISGNVGTDHGVEEMIANGVDAIKVGIGPGSICTTRIVTGVGVPQITAISLVAKKASKYNVPIIADGGIHTFGDFAKAIGVGASSIMVGNMFAGTDETPGSIIVVNDKRYKSYRGMGSIVAMKKRVSNTVTVTDRYLNAKGSPLLEEGVDARVTYKGSVSNILEQFALSLRASMTYTGNANIADMQNNSSYVRISQASLKENYTHDIFLP